MSMRQGYRGYCTHNSFGEYRMPVPAQNILFRDYSNKYGLYLKLSVNELFFKDCFLHLFSLMEELDQLDGVLMCSIFMLPEDTKLRQKVFERFLESDCELHFVLESIIIKNTNNVDELEQIFTINQLLDEKSIMNQLSNLVNENTIC